MSCVGFIVANWMVGLSRDLFLSDAPSLCCMICIVDWQQVHMTYRLLFLAPKCVDYARPVAPSHKAEWTT